MSFDNRSSAQDDGHRQLYHQSGVRVSFLLGLEPSQLEIISDVDGLQSTRAINQSSEKFIPAETIEDQEFDEWGFNDQDIEQHIETAAKGSYLPVGQELTENVIESISPEEEGLSEELERNVTSFDSKAQFAHDDEHSHLETTANDLTLNSSGTDIKPHTSQLHNVERNTNENIVDEEHQDAWPSAEETVFDTIAYEPVSQKDETAVQWQSTEDDVFDNIAATQDSQAEYQHTMESEKSLAVDEDNDGWSDRENVVFECFTTEDIGDEIPDEHEKSIDANASLEPLSEPATVEDDFFGQIANKGEIHTSETVEDDFFAQITNGTSSSAQQPADDDFFAQINQNSQKSQLEDNTLQTQNESEVAPPVLIDSLWDDVFAEEEPLLNDAAGDLGIAPSVQAINGPVTSAQTMSWGDMTREEKSVVTGSAADGLIPVSKDISWDDTPAADDFLASADIGREQNGQPAEISWDDAFADDDDDDFLAGFSAAASADTTQPQVADQAHQDESTASRRRSSGARLSYVPTTAQTTQPARATSSQWPNSYSVVPQPSMPTHNPVESAVRATGTYSSPYDMPDDFAVKPQPRKRTASNQSSTQSPTKTSGFPFPQPTARISSLPPPSASQQAPKPVASQASQQGFFEDLPIVPKKRAVTPSGRYAPQAGARPGVAPPPPPAGIIGGQIPSVVSGPGLPSNSGLGLSGAPLSAPPPPHSNSLYAPRTHTMNQAPAAIPPPILQRPTAAVSPPSLVSQLQAPERLAPYADDQGVARSVTVPAAPVSARYSPAPGSSAAPSVQTRYASQPLPRPALQQYAPRTSSPLTYQPISHDSAPTSNMDPRLSNPPPLPHQLSIRSQSLLETVEENTPITSPLSKPPLQSQAYVARESTPPPISRSGPSSNSNSPRKRSTYLPSGSSADMNVIPPKRSQTSSPGGGIRATRNILTTLDRPASAQGALSPTRSVAPLLVPINTASPLAPRLNGPQTSQIIPPNDERANDPLQRWRGHPVMTWGSGGSIVTAFPTYFPRYVSGQALPLLQPGGGEFKVSTASGLLALREHFAKFPGPLKKGKKKELLLWLKNSIERLENQARFNGSTATQSSFEQVRLEERILLWKVLSLLVEHDGVLEGTPAVSEAVKQLLKQVDIPTLGSTGLPLAESTGNILPDASSAVEVAVLRSFLKTGDAEKAVWHAVDQRLWGPAFLISSTLSKDIWKQVIQEFVRKEVRDKALAALFQVFAGNWDESIDELVSVSARAGFQMVNTTTGPTGQQDALAGLEKWRETLLLIMSNRSPGDAQALVAIGRVLTGYGRYEAAHICFIFASLPGLFGGSDDPTASFSLVGGDPNALGNDFGGDMESILLSEVYEFALSISPTPITPVPHFQAYKLYHAETLAENGLRSEAQQYCDAVNTTIHSKTSRSPYYNVALMQSVDALQKRLSEAPVDSSSSWKPSIDKVSSSLWGKFNSFVAGEEKKEGSPNPTDTPPEPGQFQRFAGDTPPMSQTPVTAAPDLYGIYQSGAPSISPQATSRYPPSNAYAPQRGTAAVAGNRYQPGGSAYQPRSSMESSRSSQDGRPSFEHLSLSPPRMPGTATLPSLVPQAPQNLYHTNGSGDGLRGSPYQASPINGSPYGSFVDQKSTLIPNGVASSYSNQYESSSLQAPVQQNYTSPHSPGAGFDQAERSLYGTPDVSHNPQEYFDKPEPSYEPQSSSYEPYSYQPYDAGEETTKLEETTADDAGSSEAEQLKPKKKSFMDDDDDADLIARAAALKKSSAPTASSAPSATREPDDAVRRAAEADGM
jgi:hypothetical protein